jgi:hypothetical protein
MMVARHKMPGAARSRSPSRRVRYDWLARTSDCLERWTRRGATVHTVPYGTDHVCTVSQAFHAWLPSFRPSGTQILNATSFQFQEKQ